MRQIHKPAGSVSHPFSPDQVGHHAPKRVGHLGPKWVSHLGPKRVGHHAPKWVGHHVPKWVGQFSAKYAHFIRRYFDPRGPKYHTSKPTERPSPTDTLDDSAEIRPYLAPQNPIAANQGRSPRTADILTFYPFFMNLLLLHQPFLIQIVSARSINSLDLASSPSDRQASAQLRSISAYRKRISSTSSRSSATL